MDNPEESVIEEIAAEPVSKKPNVAGAGKIMMASLFLSRILGIVREMIINHRFGQSEMTDAYRLAFSIPDILFYLIAAGALSSAFIPVFSEYWHTDRRKDAWRVFSSVTTITGCAVIVLVLLSWVFSNQLVGLTASGAPEHLRPMIAQMSRVLMPAQFAFLVGGLMFGTLYARQVFSIPALSPNIYNGCIILGAIFIAPHVTPAVSGMTWGALIGAFLGSFLIPLTVMRKIGSDFRLIFDVKHPGVKKVFKLMAPVIFGLSLAGVFPIILRTFGSYYAAGVVTAFENANQLNQAPLGIFGQSLAIAAFPALSQFFAQDRMDLYCDQLGKTLRQVIYLSIPIAVLFFVVPNYIVAFLFQHGKFTASDTARTAACLRMYSIGVAAWCLQPVLMRAFFSIHRTLLPIVIGTLCTAVFVGLCMTLADMQKDYTLFPLAGSITGILLVLSLMIALRAVVGDYDTKGILTTLLKSISAAAAPGLGLYLLSVVAQSRYEHLALIYKTGLICVLLCSYGWLYYYVSALLRMPEVAYVTRAMQKSRKTAAVK